MVPVSEMQRGHPPALFAFLSSFSALRREGLRPNSASGPGIAIAVYRVRPGATFRSAASASIFWRKFPRSAA